MPAHCLRVFFFRTTSSSSMSCGLNAARQREGTSTSTTRSPLALISTISPERPKYSSVSAITITRSPALTAAATSPRAASGRRRGGTATRQARRPPGPRLAHARRGPASGRVAPWLQGSRDAAGGELLELTEDPVLPLQDGQLLHVHGMQG